MCVCVIPGHDVMRYDVIAGSAHGVAVAVQAVLIHLPKALMGAEDGPMKDRPAASTRSAKEGFSLKKP